MKSYYKICLNLFYLLVFLSAGTLSSCSEEEDDLVIIEKVSLRFTSPLPDSVDLGESFAVNFTSNATQVAVALATESNPDSLFDKRTLENSGGAFSFTVDVPAGDSWNGNFLLHIEASKGSETYAVTRAVVFGEPVVEEDEEDDDGISRPEALFLVGGSTAAGWTPEEGIPFTVHEKDGKVFHDIFTYLAAAGGGFKVLPTQEGWEGGYGLEGDALSTSGGAGNFTIEEDGFYRIRFTEDDEAPLGFTYEIIKSSWGIIGDAANGWGDGQDMEMVAPTAVDDYTWEAIVDLGVGAIKFRENGGWDMNFGQGEEEGSLAFNGSTNITVATAGKYTITLNFDPQGYSYSLTEVE